MTSYEKYVTHLDGLLSGCEWGRKLFDEVTFHGALNGKAAAALRDLVDLSEIKHYGAFFTGELLAKKAVSAAAHSCIDQPVCDPACGAGDLLLRWVEFFPVSDSLEETISSWESRIFGYDIHPEFIKVTKRRLALSAIARGAKLDRGKIKIDERFPGIVEANFLKSALPTNKGTIVVNPPYNQINQQDSVTWGKGKISQAAIFLARCVEKGAIGQRVVAVLPDVLRSGSRYEKWRDWMNSSLEVISLKSAGRFSRHADIDVFLLDGIIQRNPKRRIPWTPSKQAASKVLESICEICVGSVVPHRDPQRGHWVSYFTTKDLAPWEKIDKGKKRRVMSSTVTPPFVAVRRTSSPSDKERPVASIVDCDGPVALENHLIALKPKDGRLVTCNQIMELLRTNRTRAFLDQGIRCRHLTVSILKKVPI